MHIFNILKTQDTFKKYVTVFANQGHRLRILKEASLYKKILFKIINTSFFS